MRHPLHPVHILYDNNIIEDDAILQAINSSVVADILSNDEIGSSIRLGLIRLRYCRSFSSNLIQGIDLGTGVQRVLKDYLEFDKRGEGIGNPEILLLVGSSLLPDWESSVAEVVCSYRALIISYGLCTKSSDSSTEEMEHQLRRISPPDSGSGSPHHKVMNIGEESINGTLIDILSKLKNRLVQHYQQVGKIPGVFSS